MPVPAGHAPQATPDHSTDRPRLPAPDDGAANPLGDSLRPLPATAVPPVPPPPPDATQEEKDRHWLRYVYQGDRIPQLTVRAVLMGGILGMFMSISNLYTILKLGFSFGVAIASCVLSYVIWNAIRSLSRNRLSPMSILENNCMQSTATAAGASTGHTLGLAFGALMLLTGAHTPWYYVTPFVFFTAALGVFVAVPMKRQFINVEQLTFPSGMATAETLRSLHAHGKEAVRKAIALIASLILAAFVGFFKFEQGTITLVDKIFQATFHITDLVKFTGWLNPLAGRSLTLKGLGFEPSVLMIGAGSFMGLRVTLSMLASSILLYDVVIPHSIGHNWPVFVAGHEDPVPGSSIAAGALILPLKWSLWTGTSVMLFSSLVSFTLQWRTLARSFNVFRKPNGNSDEATIAAIEVPFRWVILGVVPTGIGLIVVNALAFQMAWWLGAIAVAMSFVVALVAGRATGETDFTPTGALGKVTQLIYAVLAQGDRVVNLMSAGSTSASGAAAADLLTDLKSGYLLGANPRKQFIAQFLGIFFGTLAIVPAWYLMVPDLNALQAFPLPSTEIWRAVAVALTRGLDTIPVTARYAVVIGALVGIALPLLGTLFPKAAPYLPSAMGLGLAWVVPFQTSLSFALGAVLAWLWKRIHHPTADIFAYPIAAGFIAGESIVLALLAMAATGTKLTWGT
ncbi:MAG TPA: OPT family oligopeptide transporter [Phycisphaerae bacterium]|nr:OPT family oligopeptide transporter [Phycisphaerae bacterium]HRY67150.1 OPT family oligopeptide transporter [Phycisphaerae bacterium]